MIRRERVDGASSRGVEKLNEPARGGARRIPVSVCRGESKNGALETVTLNAIVGRKREIMERRRTGGGSDE